MDLNFLCGYLYCQLEQYDLGLAYYQLTYSYVKNLYDDNPIEPLNIEKMSIILDMIAKVESQVGYLKRASKNWLQSIQMQKKFQKNSTDV